MATPPISREKAESTLAALREVVEDGFPLNHTGGKGRRGAMSVCAERMGLSLAGLQTRLAGIKRVYGLEPDPTWGKAADPGFVIFDKPSKPIDTDKLIAQLAASHRDQTMEARKATSVHVTMEGPIGVAFFGDPHVDDPGCAWGPLKEDVETCRDTEGLFAISIGDQRNNWVGRLMALYAEQPVKVTEGLALVEWLMSSLPWLLWIEGNHDSWGKEHGDPVEVMQRLLKMPGIYSEAQRIKLCLPAGPEVSMNIRHDFPGSSQFNPAHAMVRQTLFDYRDHIMACGHRHQSGYMPIWHNDPARLCHAFRVGTYKDFDHFATTKGFKQENWARSMVAIIDPDRAHDPVNFIKPCFSIAEGADYLNWRRRLWSEGRRPSEPRRRPLKAKA